MVACFICISYFGAFRFFMEMPLFQNIKASMIFLFMLHNYFFDDPILTFGRCVLSCCWLQDVVTHMLKCPLNQ